ncbi:MAG: hypothetical protein GTO24_12720 [candidate division Zixibacteria bacterium]|nr:hypothetical protein [candidate division Zixibacteria bacterium]
MAIMVLVPVPTALVPMWVSAIITPVAIAPVSVVMPVMMPMVAIAVMVRATEVKSKVEMTRPHWLEGDGREFALVSRSTSRIKTRCVAFGSNQ